LGRPYHPPQPSYSGRLCICIAARKGVDAVISTGGTLTAVLTALQKIGAEIVDIVCVIERGEGKQLVKEKTGYDVKTLIKIDVKDGEVKILE